MPETTATKQRPKYLNLVQIRLPLAGFISILHRVSGALLFLCFPLLLWLFDSSLGSPEAFASFSQALAHPLVKLILLALIWSYLHHVCTGIRCVLLDLHVGVEKRSSQLSSVAVLAVSLPMTLILGGLLLW